MKGHRRVAIVKNFFEILEQVHNKDCLHAGSKKTYARVCQFSLQKVGLQYFFLLFFIQQIQSLYSYLPRNVVEQYIKLCRTCSLRKSQATHPPLRPIVANELFP